MCLQVVLDVLVKGHFVLGIYIHYYVIDPCVFNETYVNTKYRMGSEIKKRKYFIRVCIQNTLVMEDSID